MSYKRVEKVYNKISKLALTTSLATLLSGCANYWNNTSPLTDDQYLMVDDAIERNIVQKGCVEELLQYADGEGVFDRNFKKGTEQYLFNINDNIDAMILYQEEGTIRTFQKDYPTTNDDPEGLMGFNKGHGNIGISEDAFFSTQYIAEILNHEAAHSCPDDPYKVCFSPVDKGHKGHDPSVYDMMTVTYWPQEDEDNHGPYYFPELIQQLEDFGDYSFFSASGIFALFNDAMWGNEGFNDSGFVIRYDRYIEKGLMTPEEARELLLTDDTIPTNNYDLWLEKGLHEVFWHHKGVLDHIGVTEKEFILALDSPECKNVFESRNQAFVDNVDRHLF